MTKPKPRGFAPRRVWCVVELSPRRVGGMALLVYHTKLEAQQARRRIFGHMPSVVVVSYRPEIPSDGTVIPRRSRGRA